MLTSSQTRPTALGSRLKRLRLAAAHSLTLARLRAEKYFCRRTRRRQKCFSLYLRLRAQTLRGFFDRLKRVGAIPTRFKSFWKTYFCSDQMRERRLLHLSVPHAERIIVRITRRQNASNKISHNLLYSQYSIRQNAKNPAKIFAGFLLCLIAAACHILLL